MNGHHENFLPSSKSDLDHKMFTGGTFEPNCEELNGMSEENFTHKSSDILIVIADVTTTFETTFKYFSREIRVCDVSIGNLYYALYVILRFLRYTSIPPECMFSRNSNCDIIITASSAVV